MSRRLPYSPYTKNLKRRRFSLKNFSFKKLFTKKNLIKAGIICLAGGVLSTIILYAWIAKDLPSAKKLESRLFAESTKIYARDGTLLYEIYKEKKRTIIPSEEIPQHMKQATIALEDKNFYKHIGIDFRGIIRAFFHNIFYKDRIQGGSTLTQQFVKNTLLTPERTLRRKIKEIILSITIERIYSKDEILTMYLNEIPYGANAYGVQAAAETYFSKKAKDLTLEEAAILASLPTAPIYYSPYREHKKELLDRAKYVLEQMKNQGYISEEEMKQAQVKVTKTKFAKRREDIKAPHFVMYIRELLIKKYGERMVSEGGLKVYTSLDMKKQKIAEQAVARGAARNRWSGASNASLVSIDPKTGEILAMVGSFDYWNEKIDGNVNVSIMPRQPGSAFKPIAYATAFMKGKSPATMLVDVVTDFGGGWKPHNYDRIARGLTNARYALGGSLNISSVKMLYMAGIEDTIDLAHKMGITTLNEPSRYGLALILGGGEVKLLDMTHAFGSFATGGIKHELKPILKIEDSRGKVIEENKTDEGKEVLPPSIAYQITNILSDNNARAPIFGYHSALVLPGRLAAVKTGTSEKCIDGWTIGYTPSLVAGVWVGNNDNSPTDLFGSAGAAPIWNEYMRNALAGTPAESFPVPKGIKKLKVCKISGLVATSACNEGTKTEIFAEDYNIPKDECNVHLGSVKVCKVSRKLATPYCPQEVVQRQNFKVLHAEIPSTDPAYPRWEAAVAAYAQSRGYNKYPPKENCHIHTGSGKPTIESLEVTPNPVVAGNDISITGNVNAPHGIKEIKIYFGDILIATLTEASFSTTYLVPENTPPDTYTIKVKVKDAIYYQTESITEITVNAPP